MPEPMSLTVVYQRDGPWIVAWFVEMPAVMTQGATIEEARENLMDALRLTLEVQREQADYANPASGRTAPVPRHTEIADLLASKICEQLAISPP